MPGRPPITRLLETALYVADLERSRIFYQNLMGFECFLHDERMCALGVPGGGVLLLFCRHGSASPRQTPIGTIPAHDGAGTLHLAFAIPEGAKQAWELVLATANIAVESCITWPRGGRASISATRMDIR